MKLHVMVCPICGKYNKQVMKFQDMARTYRKKHDEILENDGPNSPKLDEEAKKRLHELLEKETKS